MGNGLKFYTLRKNLGKQHIQKVYLYDSSDLDKKAVNVICKTVDSWSSCPQALVGGYQPLASFYRICLTADCSNYGFDAQFVHAQPAFQAKALRKGQSVLFTLRISNIWIMAPACGGRKNAATAVTAIHIAGQQCPAYIFLGTHPGRATVT